MPNTSIAIPDPVTFEEAIEISQSLLTAMAQGLPESELAATVTQLVASDAGARGFFVTYLTDPQPWTDQPSAAVLQSLRSAPARVADLMVKNLVMSTAMAIQHRRNQDETNAQGSDRVQQRSTQILQQLDLPEIQQRVATLQTALATGEGEDVAFLDRWGYDQEQRQAMQAVLQATFG